jgi:hypothetical protein
MLTLLLIPAYFALLDAEGVVKNVIVADQSFISSHPGTYVEVDYEGLKEKNWPAIGSTYVLGKNYFLTKKPEGKTSWVFDEEKLSWKPPKSFPAGANQFEYSWDEAKQDWVKIK